MDTSALAQTMVSMQTAARVQQFSLVAVKQAHEMQQAVVDLLSQAAENGKASPAPGMGAVVDRSA